MGKAALLPTLLYSAGMGGGAGCLSDRSEHALARLRAAVCTKAVETGRSMKRRQEEFFQRDVYVVVRVLKSYRDGTGIRFIPGETESK